jgi:hypothetical protein
LIHIIPSDTNVYSRAGIFLGGAPYHDQHVCVYNAFIEYEHDIQDAVRLRIRDADTIRIPARFALLEGKAVAFED